MSADARLEAIRLLSDGQWHSGENLAQVLGISRAAVWQRMQGLQLWGLELHAVRGRGYRLVQPLELLDEDAIRRRLSAASRERIVSIEVIPVLDSTNTWLMSQANGAVAGVCLAEYQSAGRGRRGRQWHSPFGANLYLSLAWRFTEMPSQFSALGLVVGVTLAEVLLAQGVQDIGLKWPNDLLWRGRKLSGVLVEHRGEGGGPARVVLGVGLNVAMTQGQAGRIDQPWVTVQEIMEEQGQQPPSRNELAACVINALVEALVIFSEQGFAGFRQRWAQFDVARDAMVGLEHDGQMIGGIARGIDEQGALMLEMNGRQQRFLSGDLSLRLVTERP